MELLRRPTAILVFSALFVLIAVVCVPTVLLKLLHGSPATAAAAYRRSDGDALQAARTVYSGASIEQGNVLYLDVMPLRARRSASDEDRRRKTSARRCGEACQYRLYDHDHDEELIINLTRWRQLAKPRNSSLADLSELVVPIVQYIDTDNATRARVSTADRGCLYSALVVGSSTSTILNLCDNAGGLFGSLALPDGTYMIEPIGGLADTDSRTRRKGGRKPHLLYKARSHAFHRYDDVSILRQTNPTDSLPSADDDYHRLDDYNTVNDADNDDPDWIEEDYRPRKARARRSANSWDHYVEVMVVTDVKMLQYHQGNLENYVLTLFSTVASIYRHPSLRAAINVVVVRLVILKHDQAGPSISENAQDTLQQFCRWQASYNDPSDDSPNHHDVAILLTRHDICRAPGKCDTLGLAELGTMCDEFRSCAIIEDNGLSAAFTIAHELGHIFNIPHDDEKKCGQFMALNKNNYHIMAPTLEYNTHPWSWSPCSAAMLSKFLDNSRAQTQCIYDQPVEKKYYEKMFDNPAPGAMFTVDQQCQFVFGKNAELCPYMPSCKRLWCATYYGYQMGCRTQHMPWADGTPCGDNQWCHRGQCVGIAPAQMPKSDGAWGEWKEWGDCSRTCGGGVQKALRDCDNPAPRNGGRYCIGIRTRYRPCNVQDCPWDTPGFREVQCADFNEKNVGIHGVPANTRWLPKYAGISENERCKLYCRVDGSAAFYLLADKVADGTPCDREGDNMCIDGTCNAAGCDHVLGSSLKRDKCGICGGDGNSCHMVTGAYNERGTFGYNEVMKIPSGSANIEIRQHGWNGHKDDDNYLALRNANGDFILNGHYQVSVFRQQIQVLDAVLEYSGSDHVIERINATGPIRTDIYLHVLSVGNLYAPDIHYEYMLPAAGLRHAPTVINRDYYWRMGDRWSDCSAVCQGSQRQVVICVDAGTNREVNDRHCTDRRPTTQDRMCNIDCAIRWETEAASACSVECGHGERHQRIFCGKQMVNDQRVEPTDDAHCRDLPRPAERVACYSDCTGHRWAYTEWSECTTSCGGGVGRREAMCVDQANRRLDDRQCESMPKEKNERECNLTPCPRWVYGHWSECSRSCDGGVRMRHASCQDAADREVQMGMCDQANKHDREKCNEQVCTKWNFGPWSQCSVSCGDGVQSREAHCVNSASQTLEEDRCDQRERITNKMCRQADCPRWQLGEWSDCSVSCMDGWRTRRVACVDGEGRDISMDRCIVEGENKPPSHQPCHRGVCPFWRIGDWSSCSVTCGTGFRQRTSECVYNDELVDSSFCSEPVEPKRQERCVLVACATWDVQPWDSCSVTCGVGTQQRRVRCVQGADRAETIDSECATDERPKDVKECTRDRCPLQRPLVGALISTDAAFNPADSTPLPVLSITTVAFLSETTTKHPIHWATGPWTECSSVCGAGERRRLVVCRDNYRSLTDEYCGHLEKPLDSEPCEAKPCAEWTVGPWEECAKTCGADIRTSRRVECELTDEARNQVPPKCDEALRPEDSRSCDLPACPAEPPRTEAPVVEGRWRTEPWGQCSRPCDAGWRRRRVDCVGGRCDPVSRPPEFELCNSQPCSLPRWQISPWFQCSATCGGGSRRRRVWCADERNILAETQCAQQPKPTGDERCAEHHCPTSTTTTPEPSTTFPPPSLQNTNGASLVWIAGRWSPCSTTCGKGVRTRTIKCVDTLTNSTIPNDRCVPEERPIAEHRCRMARCPRWRRGKWSMCSVTCGRGVRTRAVTCHRGRRHKASDSECAAVPKPQETAKCQMMTCPAYHWTVGPWSKCSEVCQQGRQVRRVSCVSNLNQRAAPRMCEGGEPQPPTSRDCISAMCPYQWVPGPWSTCSKSCGKGYRYRRLDCRVKKSLNQSSDGAQPHVPARMCHALPRPAVSKECAMSDCNADYHWSVGPWTPCSTTCGTGFRKRRVRCLNRAGDRASKHDCNVTERPHRRQSCFLRNCLPGDCAELVASDPTSTPADGIYTVLVAGFQVSVYCHLMNETHPKTFINVEKTRNFAEIYGKRLLYPFTCPHNGERNDSCECSPDISPTAGLTRFEKVRVDFHNMKININDMTFATTEYGVDVPYGVAGDCYSAVDCPQGRFSIDLRGTGLRIADQVRWTDRGHRTSSRIERAANNALVLGRCGGYCGECNPDKWRGLVLEVDQKQRPSVGAG